MKSTITLVCFLVMIAFLYGCNSRESSPTVEPVAVGTDTSVSAVGCQKPPKTFIWGKKTYTLKTIGDSNLEPGMKLGYLACDNGKYKQLSEGQNATFNIYTLGSPLESNDLLYLGKWGRALYTAE